MMIRRAHTALAFVALALAPAPAVAEDLAFVDLRPTLRGTGGRTDLDLLSDAVDASNAMRDAATSAGASVVATARLQEILGKFYRVDVFACREDRDCLRPIMKKLRDAGVGELVVGTLEVRARLATARLIRFDTESGKVAATGEIDVVVGDAPDTIALREFLGAAELAPTRDGDDAGDAGGAGGSGNDDSDDAFDLGDEDGGDDAFHFGDDDAATDANATITVNRPLPFSLGGFLRTDVGVWSERIDDNPFAKGRQSLDLWFRYRSKSLRLIAEGHVEYDTAYLHERDSYGDATLEAYERVVDTREVFASLSAGDFELTVGRQITPWGEGELITPLDVVNPRDSREPGITEVDDARLPVLATRLGYYGGDHRVEAMVVHESWFGYRSPPLGPFSPVASLLQPFSSQTVRYRHLRGRFEPEGQQLVGRWLYRGPGLDFGIYGASVLDQLGAIVIPGEDQLTGAEIELPLSHQRYSLAGVSVAAPAGAWILRTEVAAAVGYPVNTDESAMTPAFGIEETHVVTPMIGATYSGIADTTLVAELSRAFFVDEPDAILVPLDAPTLALRASHRALRGDLEIRAIAYLAGASLEYGWVLRAEARYAIRDALHATLGYVTYQPGDEFGPLTGFETHDRAFAQVRWDFTLR